MLQEIAEGRKRAEGDQEKNRRGRVIHTSSCQEAEKHETEEVCQQVPTHPFCQGSLSSLCA